MKLYKVEQDVNHEYDTYDSMVVCAKNTDDARSITLDKGSSGSWASREQLKVTYIGTPSRNVKRGVVIASFNAG